MSVSTSVRWNRSEIAAAIARYLKIGDGRPRPVAEPRVTQRPVRPPKAPVREHLTPVVEHKAPAKASSRVARCYDCEGEIDASMDQCPHCALFLDPVRLAQAA